MKKRSDKLFIVLSFLIVFLVFCQIVLSNSLASEGQTLEKIKKEISLFEEENDQLKSKTASMSCLSKLSLIAEEKGYIKNPPVINLSNKIPVAVRSN
ncbi:hypothetical protein ACFLZ1_02640 [Patescibacteria group bacterium]